MRLAAVAAVLSAIAAASSAAQPQSPSLAITNVALIAMIDDTIALPDRTIVVSGDRISAVGPSATVAVPRAARVIDGRGKYLIPGLSDMHVHLEYFDKPDILDLFIANGVTTVRNMDGRPYLLDWKKQTAAGVVTGPRIYTAGPLLDGNPPVRPDNTVVETATAARAAVEVQAAANYDFVKVYSGLSADAFAAIVATAREKRLSVAGHVPRAVGLDAVLASGLRSIEHLADYSRAVEAKNDVPVWSKRYLSMPVDPERITSLARRVANAGVWSVPTLIQPHESSCGPSRSTIA